MDLYNDETIHLGDLKHQPCNEIQYPICVMRLYIEE